MNTMTLNKVISLVKRLSRLLSLDSRKRYEARHDLVTLIAFLGGFRTYNRNLSWFSDNEYKTVWSRYPDTTGYIHERKYTLYQLTKALNNVPGDIAECGVFRAGSSFLMLTASMESETPKHFYGFDSFEGLSAPSDLDRVTNTHTFKWSENDMAVDEGVARKNLEAFQDRITLYKGWIPERFNEVSDKKFSLVHIDVDLYDPTLATLDFFSSRMNVGGMIVCDDYGSEACPGARQAMDEFAKERKTHIIHLTTGQGIFISNELKG